MKKTILITSAFLGEGDEVLGSALMGSFLRKLCLTENLPTEIIFYNSGVKLLAEGSAVLDAIEMLSKKGIHLIACGTCVGHYELKNVIDSVEIGDMAGIISEVMTSNHVVTV